MSAESDHEATSTCFEPGLLSTSEAFRRRHEGADVRRKDDPRASSLWRTCLGTPPHGGCHEGGQRFLTATGRPFRPRLSGTMSGCSAEPQELRRGRDRCFRSVAIDLTERVAPRSVPSSLLRRHQRGAGGPISRVLRHPALSVSSTVRTASRSTCGVGLSVSRLIPTSDYPTRTFTSALSSVSRHRPEEHQSSLPG